MLLVAHRVSLPGRTLGGMARVRRIIQASEMREFELKRITVALWQMSPAQRKVVATELAAVARDIGVEHHAVNLSAGIRVDSARHAQNVNAYHSRLKD